MRYIRDLIDWALMRWHRPVDRGTHQACPRHLGDELWPCEDWERAAASIVDRARI